MRRTARLGAPSPPRPAGGVSYVELMVVVAVVTVLTALVLPTARTVGRRVKEKELRRALAQVRKALDDFHLDWQKGCVETDDEYGWPTSLEDLVAGVERSTEGACASGASGSPPVPEKGRLPRKPEPETRVYLSRIPRDPFNLEDDELDVNGWRARAYDDDPDATSWGGDGIYDIYSGSPLTALDGTKYEEW